MNIKALALAAVTAVSTAAIAPAPAEAFWGPSNDKVCEATLPYAQNIRDAKFAEFGQGNATWKSSVTSADKNAVAPALGYKFVTGCTTQFTHGGSTYIQGYNVESDSVQYYVSLPGAIQLN